MDNELQMLGLSSKEGLFALLQGLTDLKIIYSGQSKWPIVLDSYKYSDDWFVIDGSRRASNRVLPCRFHANRVLLLTGLLSALSHL